MFMTPRLPTNDETVCLLYMEDDEGLAELFAEQMQDAGFVVEIAQDGEEGVRTYNPERHHIIILDYNMPKKDGMQVLREMIPDPQAEITPAIIMLTGEGNEQLAADAMAEGAAYYVIKDINQSYLRMLPQVIKRVVEQQRLKTEKREAEAQIRSYVKKLERLNRQLQVATEEAEEARAIAEQASMAKTDFLNNMSHEIRTPLNCVVGYADLLSRSGLTNEQQNFSRMILTASEMLLGLINDVLDYSKIESGEMELENIPVILTALAREVVNMLETRAVENNVELAVRMDDDLPLAVTGDPMRLRQTLINLVSNAIKFSAGGQVLLDISYKQADTQDMAIIRFEVIDTGIGIPEDKLETIFEKFTQADASTTRQYGGTGLGLTISKRLVEAMGSHIQVESTVGKGSTFWFEIPMQINQTALSSQDFQLPAHLQNIRILIVDDYPINGQLVEDFFTGSTVYCHGVTSGHAALIELKRAKEAGTPYDIALIDYSMPEMNGFELGDAIREQGLADGLRMILFTAIGKCDEIGALGQHGFVGNIIKPIYHYEMVQCLDKLIQDKPLEQDNIHILSSHFVRESVETISLPQFNAKILVAEDFPTNQAIAGSLLGKLGCEVEFVDCGVSAIRRLETVGPDYYDLVLMDHQMPNMNGIEAAKHIRQRPWRKKLLIIAMTAATRKGDREACLDAGMNDYIPKPISVQQVQETLEKYLPPHEKKRRA